MSNLSERVTLRDLPLAMRLVIAAFLVAVMLGYVSAMVQLKMQLASPGEVAPAAKNVISAYHGEKGVSQLERLLEAPETHPFNGQGSMRAAYTKKKSGGWPRSVRDKGNELKEKDENFDPKDPKNQTLLDELVAKDRDGERLALLDWIRKGKDPKTYEDNKHPLTGELKTLTISEKFVEQDEAGNRYFKVQENLDVRCVRCHSSGVGGSASHYPLDTWEDLADYLEPEVSTGMSLEKLAQTTHVHLFGFAILWSLTGLIFAATSYPGWLRVIFGPWVLVAQIVDVSCWWLARLPGEMGPMFAQTIMVTGGLVAFGLVVQVVGSLFNMFGWVGKALVLLLLVAAVLGLGGLYVNVVAPYLQAEVVGAVSR